jgi:plasmid stabilization system protein ParE
VIVRFAPEARDAIREKRAWWEAHREKAPTLFEDELREVVAKLRSAPHEGQRYAVETGEVIWRVLMPKTRTHVYYRIDAQGDVDVVTVWNAQGGTGPELSP